MTFKKNLILALIGGLFAIVAAIFPEILPPPSYALCDSFNDCRAITGIDRDIDGRIDHVAKNNATQACLAQNGFYDSHSTTVKSISCDFAFGFATWDSGRFIQIEEPICSTGEAKVIDKIVCRKK